MDKSLNNTKKEFPTSMLELRAVYGNYWNGEILRRNYRRWVKRRMRKRFRRFNRQMIKSDD